MVDSFLHPFAKPARPAFISVVRGEGALLWTADGAELVDAMASLWYCNVGHGRREIADAVAAQIQTLEAYSCFEPFSNPPADELADRLAELSPIPSSRVFLCGSGSEAVDTAIKLARLAHTLAGDAERTVVISRQRGYHGTNLGGTSAQGIEPNRQGWGPLVPDIVQVPADDIEALSVLMADRGTTSPPCSIEPVQGAGGVFPPPPGYLAEARALCDRHGALLVFDEVITGFGRLGTWFAAEAFDVVPDMITFAKAVTSGYQQVGGVIVGPAGPRAAGVRRQLHPAPRLHLLGPCHGLRGGAAQPRSCCDDEALLARAEPLGKRLAAGLESLAADGVIDHVRGTGAVWAAGLRPDQDAVAIRDAMLAGGVVTRAIGTDTCTFCPPLVTTDEQIDRIVDTLATAAAGGEPHVRASGRLRLLLAGGAGGGRHLGRLEHALGEGVVEVVLGLLGGDLQRRGDLADQVDPGPLVHRALGGRQRGVAVAGGEVPHHLGDLVHVAALQLLLVVLEPPAPVRRHTRVGLGEHGHEVLELVGRHRRAHADLLGHVDRDLQRHLVDDGLQDEVLALLAERLHLLRPHHDARTVLGIDDGVTLLELHAEPSRREKSGTSQDTARLPESDRGRSDRGP